MMCSTQGGCGCGGYGGGHHGGGGGCGCGGHHGYQGCNCSCHQGGGGCSCACHQGGHGHHGGGGSCGGDNGPRLRRRFYSKQERTGELEAYLKDLEAEIQGVREALAGGGE